MRRGVMRGEAETAGVMRGECMGAGGAKKKFLIFLLLHLQECAIILKLCYLTKKGERAQRGGTPAGDTSSAGAAGRLGFVSGRHRRGGEAKLRLRAP